MRPDLTSLRPTEGMPHPDPAIAPLILLAEDNENNVETLCLYLKYHPYRVIVARTGEEAVALTTKTCPNLILMDIHMPILDGLAAIRLIRANPQFATLPIIALTALAMPDAAQQCLAAGANRYLSKPVKLKQLMQEMQLLLMAATAPTDSSTTTD